MTLRQHGRKGTIGQISFENGSIQTFALLLQQ
jgi:hypothetical protein